VAAAHSDLIFSNRKGIRSVEAEEYSKVKQHLNTTVRAGLQNGDVVHADAMVRRIVNALR
jgi:hypothetical protein